MVQDRKSQFLNEVFSYDRIGNQIQRRDTFIAGKVPHEKKGIACLFLKR